MKKLYPGQANCAFAYCFRAAVLSVVMLLSAFFISAKAQGLVFKNPVLVSGSDGQDGALYRFSTVNNSVDALVQINGRSSSYVTLETIDLTGKGFDKAFQPQVTCNHGTTPSGVYDWWMEFAISFVSKNTSTLVNVSAFNVTGLDIDGNDDKINEWVSFYGLAAHTFESNTLLQYSPVSEVVDGLPTIVGKKFVGPITNYIDIDTGATTVMVTASYLTANSFRLRTGGHSTGVSGASDRMYSFWFKSFDFQMPVQIGLPVALRSFNAKLENKKPVLSWASSTEKDLSHYIVQRSENGSDFSDVAYVFSNGLVDRESKYSIADNAINTSVKKVVYYRLKMVDIDGQYKFSETRLMRLGEWSDKNITIHSYPNPATTDLRITVPGNWQQKKVQYEIYNTSGQLVIREIRSSANQTEAIDVSSLQEGVYLIKVFTADETGIQRFIKNK